MATTARLDLSAWRNDEVWEYPLRVRGMDLSGLDLDMEARLREDAPGAPQLALAKVTNAGAEGLRVASVYSDKGVTVSDLRIRINKPSRQALPYQGEIGEPLVLAYAMRFGGRTRVTGKLTVLPHAFGSNAAPANRVPAWRPNPTGLPEEGATMVIAGDEVTEITLDGAGILERAEAAAEKAEAAAYSAGYGVSVATYSDLAGIPAGDRHAGMPVYVRDVGFVYRLADDMTTWLDAATPVRDSIRLLRYDWKPGASLLGTNGIQLRVATAIDLAIARRDTTAEVNASREQGKLEVRTLLPDWSSGLALVGTNGRILKIATTKDMVLAAAKVTRDIAKSADETAERVRELGGDWQPGVAVAGNNGKALRLITAKDLVLAEERLAAGTRAIVTPLLNRATRRHIVAAIGDSRAAAIAIDALKLLYSASSGLNWANAMLGGRLVVLPGFGVSGERTDQIMTRIDLAIATGAGTLYILCGVNDVAQQYPGPAASGGTAFLNIRFMAERAIAAGMIVVIELEAGADNLDIRQVAQVAELNALLLEWAEGMSGVHISDARGAVMDPSRPLTKFRPGMSQDGVHQGPRGSFCHGRVLAPILAGICGPRPLAVQAASEVPNAGRRQLLKNALFTTTTGGTLVGNVTGTVPANWLVRTGGMVSVAVSTRADPDGLGNNMVLDISFGMPGDEVQIVQDVSAGDWIGGDIVQPIAVAELLAPTEAVNLITVLGINVINDDDEPNRQSVRASDGDGLVIGAAGIHEPAKLTLHSRPFRVLPPAGRSYLSGQIRIRAAAAGTARIAIRSFGMRRRDTLY